MGVRESFLGLQQHTWAGPQLYFPVALAVKGNLLLKALRMKESPLPTPCARLFRPETTQSTRESDNAKWQLRM